MVDAVPNGHMCASVYERQVCYHDLRHRTIATATTRFCVPALPVRLTVCACGLGRLLVHRPAHTQRCSWAFVHRWCAVRCRVARLASCPSAAGADAAVGPTPSNFLGLPAHWLITCWGTQGTLALQRPARLHPQAANPQWAVEVATIAHQRQRDGTVSDQSFCFSVLTP